MIRWHAELYIEKSRTPDAVYTSASKDSAIGGILQYMHTMVKDEEQFKVVVKPIKINEEKVEQRNQNE